MSRFIFSLIALVTSILPLYAQTPTYEALLKNDTLVNSTTYEFDVYFKRTGSIPFEAYGFQLALLFRDSIRNGGTLTATYISGSSEMLPIQIPNNPNISTIASDGKRVFKLAGKIPSAPGQGTIISNTGNGTRLGRFRISLNGAPGFLNITPDFSWNFDQVNWYYATKVNAYVGGFPADITVQSAHLNQLTDPTLPVELSSIQTLIEGRAINLIWKTETELNSNRFEVERSIKLTGNLERYWNKIGEVNASGTSSTTREYSFIDNMLQSGNYIYRLKIVDNDGTFEYSKEVESEIALPKDYAISQNYPNPFNPTTRIDYQLPSDSKVTIELYGVTGEKVGTIVNSELEAGYYTADINSSALNLASGMYIYRMNAAGQNNQNFVQVKKLMLLK